MKYIDKIKPIYNVSDKNKDIIKKIEKKLSIININENIKRDILQKKARVRMIHSSLAIEANSLSLEEVKNVIENKTVLANRKEIQEVKNANELYEHISEFDWKDENDFLKAHELMMRYLEDDNGSYRNHGEAVKKGDEIIFVAPESVVVPSLMQSLFKFINENEKTIHPLILSSLFHYYLVYIHPFTDGNGRMARFWVSLMLINYNIKFKIVPIEEEIYLNQEEYYNSIASCHINGNANIFIDFMLKTIDDLLEKTTQKTTQKMSFNDNQIKIIELIKENPKITRKELAKKINITDDGVKYNLKKLAEKGIIKRIGAKNGGHWLVEEN